MSLRANIDHLAAAPGIVAVTVADPNGALEFRGEESWNPILAAAMEGEGDETVAVVLPTGHAIAKSLRRMIRRMSRKVRAPIGRPAAVQTGATPDSSRPSSSWG
jgi:hypothetical protein